MIGAGEQCLLQGQKAGHPEAHAKVCVGTGSDSVLPLEYFENLGALRLLPVAFESLHPLLKVKRYVMGRSQWFRLTNREAVSQLWTTTAKHRTSEHV